MIIEKSLPYAKEVGDVAALTVKIVETIKNKGDYMSLMPQLVSAVDGVSDIDDELKANRKACIATVGYHSGEMVDALLG